MVGFGRGCWYRKRYKILKLMYLEFFLALNIKLSSHSVISKFTIYTTCLLNNKKKIVNNNSSTNNNSAIELLACVAWTIIYFSFNFLYMNCISLVNWNIPWANYGFISNVALLFLYKGRKCTNTCSHRTYLSICWFLSVISNYTIKTSSFK